MNNTVHDLLMSAPASQVARCKLAEQSVAAGDWSNAAHFLRNAAREEGDSPWGLDAADIATQCAMNAA